MIQCGKDNSNSNRKVKEPKISYVWVAGTEGQSDINIRAMHIPPSHDPSKLIPKGIWILINRRPLSRLVFDPP